MVTDKIDFVWKGNTQNLSASLFSPCSFSVERKLSTLCSSMIRISNGLLTDKLSHRVESNFTESGKNLFFIN